MSIDSLYTELAHVAVTHMDTITGREFQKACLDIAYGYFDAEELDDYADTLPMFIQSLAKELHKQTEGRRGGS